MRASGARLLRRKPDGRMRTSGRWRWCVPLEWHVVHQAEWLVARACAAPSTHIAGVSLGSILAAGGEYSRETLAGVLERGRRAGAPWLLLLAGWCVVISDSNSCGSLVTMDVSTLLTSIPSLWPPPLPPSNTFPALFRLPLTPNRCMRTALFRSLSLRRRKKKCVRVRASASHCEFSFLRIPSAIRSTPVDRKKTRVGQRGHSHALGPFGGGGRQCGGGACHLSVDTGDQLRVDELRQAHGR